MASNVTLTQLRTDARLYADLRPGGANSFINDTEIDRLINLMVAELSDLVALQRGHEYSVQSDFIVTVAGTTAYALPADHYQTLNVVIEWDENDHEVIPPMALLEADVLKASQNWGRHTPKGYRIIGANVVIHPAPTSVESIRHDYSTPSADLLSMPADTLDGINGWEKLIALGVAVEMRTIARKDASDLQRLFDRQYARVEAMAADRDAAHPKRVLDIGRSRGLRWERLPRP